MNELPERPTQRIPVRWIVILWLAAAGLRFFFNGSSVLIPGVNGGYYPLQVRSVLDSGGTGIADMPLLFIANAAVITLLSLNGVTVTDALIIETVKAVDSISLPLLLIPLTMLIRRSHLSQRSMIIALSAFSVLSLSPLIMTSDLQKNAAAVPLAMASIAAILRAFTTRSVHDFGISLAFGLLTLLTHFGTFVFLSVLLMLTALFAVGKRAVVPSIVATVIGGAVIALFDAQRFFRIINILTELFGHPALFSGMIAPPEIAGLILGWSVSAAGITVLIRRRAALSGLHRGVVFASVLCIIIMSLPLLDAEYFRRLGLLLFIPEILILLHIAPLLTPGIHKFISGTLVFYTLLSVTAVLGNIKQPVITDDEYQHLQGLKEMVGSEDGTIVIARHGLEWWTAFALRVKVSQEKSIDPQFFEKYRRIFILRQQSWNSSEGGPLLFHEPRIPEGSVLIDSSCYFTLYQWKRDRDP